MGLWVELSAGYRHGKEKAWLVGFGQCLGLAQDLGVMGEVMGH